MNSIFDFQYEQTTKMIFGRGKLAELGREARALGETALLATVPVFPAVAGLYERVIGILEEAGLRVVHYDGCVPNPTTESVAKGTELARREKVDLVIGLGGGSSMDTAKAIAVAAACGGDAWDYLFYKSPQPWRTLPCIAVTTTSGTGSQVTQVAVLTETATRTKSAIFNNLLYPRVAIVDPELMLTLPVHVTASTGFDAFCHCFESYLNCKSASPCTDLFALEGIRAAAKYLRRAVADGADIEAREGMAWADTCGGLAIANAGVTLPHGVGMTISGHCPQIMHGESLALTYPSFLRLTRPAAVERFAVVGRILNPALAGVSDEEASAGCCEAVDTLLRDIGMWLNFRSFGVDPETLAEIARRSHDLPDYLANPVIADTEEIYRELMEGYERE